MKLLLIRHARAQGDTYARPARPVSGFLSEKGLAEARAAAVALRDVPIHLALASCYGRAIQTAEIILEGRETPLRIVESLREWEPSPELRQATSTVFEQMIVRDSARYAEETWKTDLGEGCFELYARVSPPLLAELDKVGIHSRFGGFVLDDGVRDKTLAIIAHGGSLNVILSHLLGLRPFPIGAFMFAETGVATLEFYERHGVYYPSLVIPPPGPAASAGRPA